MSKKLLEKLEKYENEAYKSASGVDWLEIIGEGFKFYIKECVNDNKIATIKGFEKYIDEMNEVFSN